MSNILIVGNSSSVIDQVQSIRQTDKDSSISILCSEGRLPYQRSLLPYWFVGDIKEAQLFPQHDQFFSTHAINVLLHEQVLRISSKRRYVTTGDKKQIAYDQMVLMDFGRFDVPDIKGKNKIGVFHVHSLDMLKVLKKMLIEVENVFLPVTRLEGLNMACALSRLEKDVIILAPGGILNNILDDETRALLKQLLEAKGIRVIDAEIEEILGDQQVKAIRLKSGKIMAAQAVLFDQVSMDIHHVSEHGLGTHDVLIQDGICLPLQLPLLPYRFGVGVLDGFMMGTTILPEGGREYLRFNGPENIFKKIYALGDNLVGAVLFNAPASISTISHVISSQESVLSKEESLLDQ